MPLAFDSAVDFPEEDSTTPTSVAAWEIAPTADRFAISGMFSRDSVPATHTAMRISGSAGDLMTQLGATSAIGLNRFSRWNLFGGGLPASGASRVLYGLMSAIQSVGMIAGAVYNGVNQATPIGADGVDTGAATEATISGVSITLATAAGDKVVGILAVTVTSIVTTSSITGVTVRTQEDLVLDHLYVVEVDAVGTSTTIAPVVTLSASTDNNWEFRAYVIQAAVAAVAPVTGNAQFSPTNPQFLAGIAVTRAELLNPKAWF